MKREMTISSDVKNFSQVERLIDEICAENNIAHDVYGKILVSMSECVTNAIVHGNHSEIDKMVEVFSYIGNNKRDLTFIVKDQGNGFNYASLPDPTSPEYVETLTGRGVFLMNALADLVIFSDNGATVELKFKI